MLLCCSWVTVYAGGPGFQVAPNSGSRVPPALLLLGLHSLPSPCLSGPFHDHKVYNTARGPRLSSSEAWVTLGATGQLHLCLPIPLGSFCVAFSTFCSEGESPVRTFPHPHYAAHSWTSGRFLHSFDSTDPHSSSTYCMRGPDLNAGAENMWGCLSYRADFQQGKETATKKKTDK